MRLQKLFDKKTGEMLISMNESDDIENVDPVKYFKDSFVVHRMCMSGIPFEELSGKKKPSEAGKRIFLEANVLWEEKFKELRNTPIPRNLIDLLISTKKNEQEKLLRGVELTPLVLSAYILEAHINFGYKFSQYKAEILPKGIDMAMMPYAAELDDNGDVKVYGETKLSKGQIKQAISQRTVTIGKFIEKGDIWHCFFANYKSLNGEEIWLGKNQPHFHYISNYFGLSRETVVNNLKSKNYKLGNLPHIVLKEYGNQPDN